jgi:hypothetical protein
MGVVRVDVEIPVLLLALGVFVAAARSPAIPLPWCVLEG